MGVSQVILRYFQRIPARAVLTIHGQAGSWQLQAALVFLAAISLPGVQVCAVRAAARPDPSSWWGQGEVRWVLDGCLLPRQPVSSA